MSGLDEGFCPCGNVIAANCACDAETLALVRSVWNMGLTTVGQKAGAVEAIAGIIDSYKSRQRTDDTADEMAAAILALIPAPSVAEAAEPVAWQHRSQFFNKDSQVLCAWSDWDDGKASDQLKARCSAGFGNFEERPLFTHPAPSPVVPSGLEALEPAAFANAAFFTERRAEFEQNGTVVEARPRGMCMHPLYSADAIAALIAERDEAKRWRQEVEALSAQWMEETGQAYAYVGIRDYAAVKERAETAERALTAALNRIAEIEGETIERCAKIAEAEAKAVDGRNADRYWQSKRIAAAIRSSATKQEKAE